MSKNVFNQKITNSYYAKYVFLFCLIFSIVLSLFYGYVVKEQNINEAIYFNRLYISRIKHSIKSNIYKTSTLNSIILSHGIDEIHFDDFAKSLMTENRGIRAFEYIEDGKVKYVYPKYRELIGINVMETESIKSATRIAKETNQITVSNPFELLNGKMGIMAINPIYKDAKLLAYTSIVMELPDILNQDLLDEISHYGYGYELKEGDEIIYASDDYNEKYSVTETLSFFNKTWDVSISNVKSIHNHSSTIFYFLTCFFVSSIISIFIYTLECRNISLNKSASTDFLTGSLNRRKLFDYLSHRILNLEQKFTLLYLDLNNFKEINDKYGHGEGDVVLKETVKRIKNSVRKDDVVARMGGDEYVVILEKCYLLEDIEMIINKIRRQVELPICITNATIHMSVSVGYAIFPDSACDIDSLLKIADDAMYVEKHHNHNKK